MKPLSVLAMLIILLVFGIVGNSDYEYDIIETQMYCDMVKDGVWPDYKGIYGEVCE